MHAGGLTSTLIREGSNGEGLMIGLESLQSVQYVTVKGKRFAILSVDDWEELINWLETLEDIQVAKKASEALKTAVGNRARAGWLKWDEIKDKLD